MCIVIVTTAHPSYALIVLDNRDEFILRPTSRPHWWGGEDRKGGVPGGANGDGSTSSSGTDDNQNGEREQQQHGLFHNLPHLHLPGHHHHHGPHPVHHVLSSRDLQRAERGTWLGMTRQGKFAVLTNYRETDAHDASHPVHGSRSRGGMVTAWLRSDKGEGPREFVERMLGENGGRGVRDVGGFSLILGRLRRDRRDGGEDLPHRLEPLAIMSNRNLSAADVPWIAGERDGVYALSNTSYTDHTTASASSPWPKVDDGKRLVREVVAEAVAQRWDETRLVEALFRRVLDVDTLPRPAGGVPFEAYIQELKKSIFVPPIGDDAHREAMRAAVARGKGGEVGGGEQHRTDDADADAGADVKAEEELRADERPDPATGFETGMYGTQRQTVILVDWDGNVTYTERALWDSNGNAVERGQGDMVFKFKIEDF